jgi:hypothetical protein
VSDARSVALPACPPYRHDMSDEDEPVQRPSAGPPEDLSESRDQSRRGVDLASLAAPATAILAVAGAAWYGLLSLGAVIVYDPLGVQPREVGLTGGTVLAQSAIGLAASLVLLFVLERVTLFLTVLVTVRPVESAAVPDRRPSLLRSLAFTSAIIGTVAIFVVLWSSLDARDDLESGRRPSSGILPGLDPVFPSPWQGEIAEIDWAGDKPSGFGDLPSCALYLGQAGGIAVIYDPAKKDTLRIPSSAVIVTTQRDRDRCG